MAGVSGICRGVGLEKSAAVSKNSIALKLVTVTLLLLPLLMSCGKSKSSRPENVGYGITLLRNTADIPRACQLAFTTLSREKRFEMANPGERYQATDMIGEQGLPWRRLIFAAVRQNRCLIDYEKGGRGKTLYLVVLDTSNHPATLVWGGPAVIQPDNVALLREKLAADPPKDPQALFQHYW